MRIVLCSVALLYIISENPLRAQVCTNNLLQNGNFTQGIVAGSMPGGQVSNWTAAYGSPDVSGAAACSDSGYVAMWGNQHPTIGEALQQTGVSIVQGNTYVVSLCVRWAQESNRPYPPRFRVRASTTSLTSNGDPAGVTIGVTPYVNTPNQWTTFILPPWVAPANYSVFTVSPENQSSFDHGDSVTYAYVDNVCLQMFSCDSISVYATPTTQSGDTCCYDLFLNNVNPPLVNLINLNAQFPVTFTGASPALGWGVGPSSTTLQWFQASGGSLPTGTGILMGSYCIKSSGQYPQTFALQYYHAVGGQYNLLCTNNLVTLCGTPKSGKICGSKWWDKNGNKAREYATEPGLAGWIIDLYLSSPSGPPIAQTVTDATGSYCFHNLPAGTYYVAEQAKPGWQRTWPASPTWYHTVSVAPGQAVAGVDFGNRWWKIWTPTILITDSSQWSDSSHWICVWDEGAGGPKSVKRLWDSAAVEPWPMKIWRKDPYQVLFNGIFDPRTDTLPDFPPGPLYGTNLNSSKSNIYRVIVNDSLLDGQPDSVEVMVPEDPDSGVTVAWVRLKSTITGVEMFRTFTADQLAQADQAKPVKRPKPGKPIPMPNTANVIDEVLKQGAMLIAGLPNQLNAGGKAKAYLHPAKQKDVFNTLNKKGVMHTGSPRGLDLDVKGKLLLKRNKSLPATKHNNRLLANLLALELNIALSDAGKTPPGFGDLVWNPDVNREICAPGTHPNCPLTCKKCVYIKLGSSYTCECWDDLFPLAVRTVKGTKSQSDNRMTNWEGIPSRQYEALNSLLESLNAAFAKELPFDGEDTLSWVRGGKLALRGAVALSDVPWLIQVEGFGSPIINPVPSIVEAQEPDVFRLEQSYPNPFNPTTTIEFSLPADAIVTLKVYNVVGQEVGTLFDNELLSGGIQEVEFDASNLSSGVYFYRIIAETLNDEEDESDRKQFVEVRKMLLMR